MVLKLKTPILIFNKLSGLKLGRSNRYPSKLKSIGIMMVTKPVTNAITAYCLIKRAKGTCSLNLLNRPLSKSSFNMFPAGILAKKGKRIKKIVVADESVLIDSQRV